MLRFLRKHSLYLSILLTVVLYWAAVAFSADSEPVQKVKITNGPESLVADVIDLGDGSKALRTSGLVQIEQLFGSDPQGSWWGYIGTADDATGVGAVGNVVTLTITAAASPLNASYPAVNVSTPVTLAMTTAPNPERALSEAICNNLNANANFISAQWKCQVIKDFSGIFINSKLYNEFGERKTPGSVTFTATGTTVVTPAFSTVERRGLGTELARSPNDPRQGILSISGQIQLNPGGVNDLFFADALSSGGSNLMNVKGTLVAPVSFAITCDSTKDTVIETLKIHGRDAAIKYGQFLGINVKLTNGILITIKSEGEMTTLPLIKSTDDLKAIFSTRSGFDLDVQSGGDHVLATYEVKQTFTILKCGTLAAGDDYVKIEIRDNLTTVDELYFSATGFQVTP